MGYKQFPVVARMFHGLLSEHRFRIRRLPLRPDLHGDCCFHRNLFHIRINRSLDEEMAIDTLLHELAHMIAWERDSDEHGLEWGKAYSRIYRLFLTNYLQKGS